MGTLNLIKTIKNSTVKYFIFSSSAGVYGNIKKAAKEKMKKLLKWKPKFNNINLILKNAIIWEKSKTYLSIS